MTAPDGWLPDDAIDFEGIVVPAGARVPGGSRKIEAVWRRGTAEDDDSLARVRMRVEFRSNCVVGRVAVVEAPVALVELRAFVTRLIQQELDVDGLVRAEAMLVSVDVWKQGGKTYRFNGGVPELELDALTDADQALLERALIFPILGSALGTAMADFRAAIWDRDRTPMHCGRAVEAIRQAFVLTDDGTLRPHSWRRMRAQLGFTEDELNFVMNASIPSRHGGMAYKSNAERVELIRRTRSVALSYGRYVAEYFGRLRVAVVGVLPEDLREAAVESVATLEQTVGSDDYAAASAHFLGLVGDNLQALDAFVPALRAPLVVV